MSYVGNNPKFSQVWTPELITTGDNRLPIDNASLRGVSDGVKWVEVGTDALPVGTYYCSSVVYIGKMWVIGGNTDSSLTRKVYSSSDGITWTEAGTDALPVATRDHSSAVFNGKMWVIGGTDGSVTRKVYSTIPRITDGLKINGPQYIKRSTSAASVTLTRDHYYMGITSTAATRTVTLPAVADVAAGKTYIIKDESGAAGTNNIIVQANAAELIDSSNTYIISSNYAAVGIVCTGTKWSVI